MENLSKPTVSVIIPTCNRLTTLVRAVRSVLSQTFRDLEVVVIDDASGIPAESVLKDFSDSRIRRIRLHSRVGASAARNVGLEASKGQFISFLDDDDVYCRRKIERQLQVFQGCRASVGLVYCGYRYRNREGRIYWATIPRKSKWDNLHHREFIGVGPLVRKQCFEEVGMFDERLDYFEDIDMWYRISRKFDFRFCREVLYEAFDVSENRSGKQLEKKLAALDRYYEKHARNPGLIPRRVQRRITSTYHFERALTFYHFDKTEKIRDDITKSLALYPFSIKGWKLMICSLIDEKKWRMLNGLFRRIRDGLYN